VSRSRKTLETSYCQGFVPWTWWVKDQTANLAEKQPLLFFQLWGFEKPEVPWQSIDEDWQPEQSPVECLPSCPKCEATSVADIEGSLECLCCGAVFGDVSKILKRT
jgi:hypothetical protein